MSEEKPKRYLLKIIVIGAPMVGKSSILERYVNEDNFELLENCKATIGADFFTTSMEIDQDEIVLQFWDTAGQERFQSLGNAFYRGADAFIGVYDMNDDETFAAIPNYINEALLNADCSKDIPVLLLSNKYDSLSTDDSGFTIKMISSSDAPDVQIQLLVHGFCRDFSQKFPVDILKICESFSQISCDTKGRSYAKECEYNLTFCEVSAKTGFNVNKAIVEFSNKVLKYGLDNNILPAFDRESINQVDEIEGKPWGCC